MTVKTLLFAVSAFLAPLVITFTYIKNRSLLIYDPEAGSGMFRGAGFVDFSFATFLTNLKFNLTNLFSHSFGYYFELNKVEFSGFYPILALIFVAWVVWRLFMSKRNLRVPIVLVVSIAITNVLLAYFTVDPTPGMRRYTGNLVAIYILFVFAWYWVSEKAHLAGVKASPRFAGEAGHLRGVRWWLAVLSLSLLPLHHLLVYPVNLGHLHDVSRYYETVWFKTQKDPRVLANQYIAAVQKEDLKLICYDEANLPINCRYSEVFAVVSAACYWNRLTCYGIYGWDLKTNQFIPLTIQLFNEYYFGKYGREIIAT